MPVKKKDDKEAFPPEEVTKRFKAVLLSARLTVHVPMKEGDEEG